MKKITLKRAAPPPPPLPSRVQAVSTEEPLPTPPTPVESVAPPLPPQMNAPVGVQPINKPPMNFEECMELAALVSQNRMRLEFGSHWAHMAQAFALKDIADSLHDLTDYLGAYDADDEKDEDGDPIPPVRISDQIAEGIMGAINVVKDDFSDAQIAAMAEIASGGKKA